MLRDLLRRATRAVETDKQRRQRLSRPFRRTRDRRGSLEPVRLGVNGKGEPIYSGFRARWVPNDSIARFHGSWWTRLRVRAGVTPITLGAAR